MEHTDWLNAGLDAADARLCAAREARHRPGTGRPGGVVGYGRQTRGLAIPATCNAQAPSDCHANLMRMRCLLVDDNGAFLETARALLGQQGVTIVGTASTSAEALRLASALRPDVVLVDIRLGDENGFDLARHLAERNGAATAVIIMISTAAEADYADLIAESQAAGFLTKTELSAAGIQRILGR
jgi:CheY-like chemotaxis protein